jgi:hypothetical protein
MEHRLARLEGHAAAGRDRLRPGRAPVRGAVATDEVGGNIGDRAVGLVVVGLADVLPGGGAADGGEGIWIAGSEG